MTVIGGWMDKSRKQNFNRVHLRVLCNREGAFATFEILCTRGGRVAPPTDRLLESLPSDRSPMFAKVKRLEWREFFLQPSDLFADRWQNDITGCDNELYYEMAILFAHISVPPGHNHILIDPISTSFRIEIRGRASYGHVVTLS